MKTESKVLQKKTIFFDIMMLKRWQVLKLFFR
jgi:hypothetical protein